jgi:lactobin A/cerein 7B family class IIb bacteriocin
MLPTPLGTSTPPSPTHSTMESTMNTMNLVELSPREMTEINGGEITAIMVALGTAIAVAFYNGFQTGYNHATS